MVWLVASAVCVGSGRARDEGGVIGGVWEIWGGVRVGGWECELCIG